MADLTRLSHIMQRQQKHLLVAMLDDRCHLLFQLCVVAPLRFKSLDCARSTPM
jgi:hypothetical protein